MNTANPIVSPYYPLTKTSSTEPFDDQKTLSCKVKTEPSENASDQNKTVVTLPQTFLSHPAPFSTCLFFIRRKRSPNLVFSTAMHNYRHHSTCLQQGTTAHNIHATFPTLILHRQSNRRLSNNQRIFIFSSHIPFHTQLSSKVLMSPSMLQIDSTYPCFLRLRPMYIIVPFQIIFDQLS
jgi:hypothetical protein